MSSNRQKPTKRRSLRKKGSTKIAKSPRRSQPSLGLNNSSPMTLTLNNSTPQTRSHSQSHSKSPKVRKTNSFIPRSQSHHSNMSSTHKQNALLTQLHQYKPKLAKHTHPSHISLDAPDYTRHTNNYLFANKMMPPPTAPTDTFSVSSISDILNTMSSVHEDSDDEIAAKEMMDRINHLNLSGNTDKNTMRKIKSNPAISSMTGINFKIERETRSESPNIAEDQSSDNFTYGNINTQIVHRSNGKSVWEENTSPNSQSTSSVSTNNTTEYLTPTHSSRFRSASLSSNQSQSDKSVSSYIKSVPEDNAIIKNDNGLLTYIGLDRERTNYTEIMETNVSTLPRVRSASCVSKTHHRMSSLSSNKDKRIRKKKSKQKRVKKRNQSKCGFPAVQSQSEKIESINNRKYAQKDGVICEKQLSSEWDCLTVSHDNEWVALFSRNSMVLLRINEYGQFEQLRDLKAGRKESRLKYGAVDAQFMDGNSNKLITCTRSGTLIVLNLNQKGRGCVRGTNCPLRQRVHKVTWIKNTQNVLAAAEDGKCYLWDTRIEGQLNGSHFMGGKSFATQSHKSSALSCKISPFNDSLFATSHRNGTLNVWDIRNDKCPFLTILAHKSSINCIDWHPAIPNVMASCGYRDITIKIWNLTDDATAQSKYSSFWNQYQHKHRDYNSEDDYRLSAEMIASPSIVTQGYKPVSTLRPICAMYPAGHVLQIGWRPCDNPKSLSANQIACSYVASMHERQVVEMWDIKSSYVPVARMSSHESETKFKFIFKNQPFRECNDNDSQANIANEPKTYLITCSKDKSTKLTDCGSADIPRSHLSSVALDIAPFGNACFVSVPRQKLHPFGHETYESKETKQKMSDEILTKSSSMGALRKNSLDLLLVKPDIFSDSNENKRNKPRSLSGNITNFGRNLRKMSANVSDSECDKARSPLRTGIFGIFAKKPQEIIVKNETENENIKNTNAMSNGLDNEKLAGLTDILNDNFDAFSEFETKLSQFPLSQMTDTLCPCDNAVTFKYLAKNYKLKGKSVPNVCKFNEKIAENIGNNELKSLWNLLAIIFGKNRINSEEKQSEVVDINHEFDIVVSDDNYLSESETESSNSFLSLNSTSNSNQTSHKKHSLVSTPPLKILQSAFDHSFENQNLNNSDIAFIKDYLEWVLSENIRRGDIQTAVTVIIILSDYIFEYCKEQFCVEYVSDLVLSYLELLLHSKLLIEAVKIYEMSKDLNLAIHSFIEEYFFKMLCKHRLIIKCIRCKQSMTDYRCFKCNKLALCNICNEELLPNMFTNHINVISNELKHSELLIWCQICGHGGHFQHMKQWFLNKSVCSIDNCNHLCQPVLISISK